MTVRQRARVERLLRALLACLAVAVIVTPVMGTAAWREAVVVVSGAAGGNPGEAQRAAASEPLPLVRTTTFHVDRQRSRFDYESPRLAVDVQLLTRVVLC